MLYHSNSTGSDPEAFRIALERCLALSSASTREMKICIHSKNQLVGHAIGVAMGDRFVKALLTGNCSAMGVRIQLETERQVNNTQMLVLAVYISSEYLEKVIAKNGNADVVYLPWSPEELDNYLNMHPNSISI